MEPELPIEFFLSGIPASAQSSRRGKDDWKARVEAEATRAIGPQIRLISKGLALEIFLFLDEDIMGDLDNIIKPIQDAMNRVVYEDDHQIEDVHIAKFLPHRISKFDGPSEVLSDAMDQEFPIVYIKIHEEF